MAKKPPLDEIIKGVIATTKKSVKKTTKTLSSRADDLAPKKGSLSRADRSAANKAKAAAEREARMKAGSARSAAERAVRKQKNREEAIGSDLREMRTDWTRGTQIRKAKEFFADEVGKALDREGATARVLVRGSQARRTFLEKEIKKFETMLEREGYPSALTIGQKRDIAREALERAAKANKAAGGRVEQVVGQAKFPKQKPEPKQKGRKGRRGRRNEAEQETITTAARRQYRKELRQGKVGKGDDAARKRNRDKQAAEQEVSQRKSLVQAKKKNLRDLPDRKPRAKKEVKEQESSKRLRAAQEKNAKRVYDTRIDKMDPKKREAMWKREEKDRKRLRDVPNLSDAELARRRKRWRSQQPKPKSQFGGPWAD